MIEDGLLDDELRPVDRLGRRQLRRLNVLVFFKAIPGFAVQFKRTVPESYFTAGKKGRCEVRCPCGATEEFELGAMHQCSGCPRIYLWSSKSLKVANTPTVSEVRATS